MQDKPKPSSKKKTQREYITRATRAAAHPVRSAILEALKAKSPQTSKQLVLNLEDPDATERDEEIPSAELNEKRYNLYHHLKKLDELNLIRSEEKDAKTRLYSLNKPVDPNAVVIILSEKQIDEHFEDFFRLRQVLEDIEGEPIPHPEKIKRVEITFHYE